VLSSWWHGVIVSKVTVGASEIGVGGCCRWQISRISMKSIKLVMIRVRCKRISIGFGGIGGVGGVDRVWFRF